MNTLLLVDGNALLYRAYHAFPKDLTTAKGEPIGAVYGFARILLTTVKTLKPHSIAVCFDLKGPTFRHASYAEYKANRSAMPEDLAGQIERTHQVVEYLEYPIYTAEGYEADDVIGTIARQATDHKVIILTGDQDIIQLVNDRVSVYTPGTFPKVPVMYTPEKVKDKYGFEPLQMIEYKALRGDPSDNIPGVPGIGEVSGKKLVQEFGTVPHMYEEIEAGRTGEVKPAVLAKLKEHKDSALMSRDLATIHTDAPVTFDPDACKSELKNPDRLVGLFQDLGFKSLMKDLPASHRILSEAADVFGGGEFAPEPEPVDSDRPLSESEKTDQLLAPVLRAMEEKGVKIDIPYFKGLENEYVRELEGIRGQLIDLAGEEFNPDSPTQVSHILYEVLAIPTTFVRKGKTGFTTDAATLGELSEQYPIAKLLLSYREQMKLLTTYARPLPTMVDEHSRLHTSYAPDTATGRLSSRNPNLQNIPNRSEAGKRIRKGFIADTGKVLVSADYSQIELRIAAHLSGDKAMQEAFLAGSDFHAQTAERMGVERSVAKMINFSILYGKGAFSFARDLGITVPEAKAYIEQYFKTYHKLREYLDNNLRLAKEQGYLETMFGRRRYFPEFKTGNHIQKAAAEREALNSPIQGSQADILKLAMVDLGEKLKGSDIDLILTVHDELVVECPAEKAAEAGRLIKESMVGAITLAVPVLVSVKQGANWAEMEALAL